MNTKTRRDMPIIPDPQGHGRYGPRAMEGVVPRLEPEPR
jgi:hypothetical protein